MVEPRYTVQDSRATTDCGKAGITRLVHGVCTSKMSKGLPIVQLHVLLSSTQIRTNIDLLKYLK